MRAVLKATAYCLFLIFDLFPITALADELMSVKDVIDGDTIVLSGGDAVRYVGIDTPEAGESFYEEAKKRNRELVSGKNVKVVVCAKEPRDKYGRLLAWVWADGVFVNKALLSDGLAKTLVIPPCGLERRAEFAAAEKAAKDKKLGIWSGAGALPGGVTRTVPPDGASKHLGEYIGVRGVVKEIREKESVLAVEFGGGAFAAVIFKKTLPKFRGAGVDLRMLKGKKVLVTGVISEYKGRAEIVVSSPAQIRLEKD